MPWCPKCNGEYEDGVLKCTDCGCDLIEDLEMKDLEWTNLVQGSSEESLKELINFLKYSKIEELRCIEDEISEGVILQVRKNEMEQAKKYVAVYLHQKNEEAKDLSEEEEVIEAVNMPVTYEEKVKKLNDLKSSAFSFLTIGSIGFIFGLMVLFDIVSLNMVSYYKYIFSVFFLTVTIAFILIGVISFRKIKSATEEVNQFSEINNSLKTWFMSNYTLSSIDEEIAGIDLLEEENRYFERIAFIKKTLSKQFPEYDDSIIEGLVDEIYEEISSF